jgi:hypothetical protein
LTWLPATTGYSLKGLLRVLFTSRATKSLWSEPGTFTRHRHRCILPKNINRATLMVSSIRNTFCLLAPLCMLTPLFCNINVITGYYSKGSTTHGFILIPGNYEGLQ